MTMGRKIQMLLPHILCAALVILVLQPSLEGTGEYYAFLAAIALIELGFVITCRNPAMNNIAIIVYLFLIVWEYMTAKHGVKNAMLYPPPEKVFDVVTYDYPKILEGIGSSLRLLFAAFGIALVTGVILGLFVGLSDGLSATIMPIVRVISPIPPIIYSPYAVAILPSFRAAAIFIVTLTVFWSIFMSMVLSVRDIDQKIMDSARTLNLNKSDMIFHVMLPYSLPAIINSVSVSVSTSFLVLTAAEMTGGTSGLGWYIKYYSDFAQFPRVVFGIIMIGIVVTLLNVLISLIRKYLIRWK